MNHTLRGFALALLLLVTACKEDDFSGYMIESISKDRIAAELKEHSVEKNEMEFILSEISGSYPLVTVIKKKENSEVSLTIDQFFLDQWTNPTTGANGTTPHGTLTTYKKSNRTWTAESSMHYE